jgi:hypothetical protein
VVECLQETDDWEDLFIGRKIILKWICNDMGWEGVDWIHLAQDSDQWRVLNEVMKFLVP